MVNNRRQMARRITRSVAGEYGEHRIGGGLVWAIRGAVAYAVCAGVYFGLEPLIDRFVFLGALLVWLLLGAHWCRRA